MKRETRPDPARLCVLFVMLAFWLCDSSALSAYDGTSDSLSDGLSNRATEEFGSRMAASEDPRRWQVGFDSVFAQPRFRNNTAFLIEEEDLNANSRQRTETFQHSLDWSPRVWTQFRCTESFTLTASWWRLDSESDRIEVSPAVNGFGNIATPDQFGIDLSSVQPQQRLDALANVDLQTIDLAMMHHVVFGRWDFGISGGLRHVSLDTQYAARLFNNADALSAQVTRRQSINALGPTIGLQASRLWLPRLRVSGGMQASMLLSETELEIEAAEDIDLVTSFTTEVDAINEDILPSFETQFMAEWAAPSFGWGTMLARGGVQSQWYGGTAAPGGEESDLGVLALFAGLTWVR